MLRSCWCLGLSGCELKPQLRKITHSDVNIQPSGILLCGIEATQVINMILAVGLRDKYFILSNTFPCFWVSCRLLVAQNCLGLPTVASLLIAPSIAYTYVCFYLFVIFFQWEAKANYGQISLLAMFGPNLPFLTSCTEEATGRRYRRASPRSASCSVTFLTKQCKLKTSLSFIKFFLN